MTVEPNTEQQRQTASLASSQTSSSASEDKVRLQLFVNGIDGNARVIIQRLEKLFAPLNETDFELEVHDVSQEPELLEQENILVLPTLVKSSPKPPRRLIGDMARDEIIKQHIDFPVH